MTTMGLLPVRELTEMLTEITKDSVTGARVWVVLEQADLSEGPAWRCVASSLPEALKLADDLWAHTYRSSGGTPRHGAGLHDTSNAAHPRTSDGPLIPGTRLSLHQIISQAFLDGTP
jgi:hypothetical protein